MIIKEEPIEYYITRLKEKNYFSFPGFSDSEWFCMAGYHLGERSAAGQLHTKKIGERLLKAFKAHPKDPNFMPAVPKVIQGYSEIEKFNQIAGAQICYERDMVTDDLAATLGGLHDFIKQLRNMDVYVIGNTHLKGLHFLKYKKFFEIPSQYNFHLIKSGGAMDDMVRELLDFGKPGVYLFSVGVSDAVMIAELHGKIPNAFLIDCGSMWDAFVGVGGNRTWREKLYADPNSWLRWINANLQDL